MAIAHSRDQLATLLPPMPWFSRLPEDVVDRFLSNTKYVDQTLAHMEHGQIQLSQKCRRATARALRGCLKMRSREIFALFILCLPLHGRTAMADQQMSLGQATQGLRQELEALKVSTDTILVRGIPNLTTITKISNVVAGPDDCSVRYHVTITNNGRIVRDADDVINLRTSGFFVDVVYEDRLPPPFKDTAHATPHYHLRAWPYNFNFADAASAERVRSKFAVAMQFCPRPPVQTVTIQVPKSD
jgi:hypothetical protein